MAELADIRDKDQVEENKQEIMKNHICTYKGVLDPTQEETWKQYRLDKIIAHGTFGLVYRGTNLSTGEIVAIKRVYQDTRFKNRELELL